MTSSKKKDELIKSLKIDEDDVFSFRLPDLPVIKNDVVRNTPSMQHSSSLSTDRERYLYNQKRNSINFSLQNIPQ